jgi:hypothetical protein
MVRLYGEDVDGSHEGLIIAYATVRLRSCNDRQIKGKCIYMCKYRVASKHPRV